MDKYSIRKRGIEWHIKPEEKVSGKLLVIGISKYFWDRTPKAEAIKAKKNSIKPKASIQNGNYRPNEEANY